jgi:hypothetical protein
MLACGCAWMGRVGRGARGRLPEALQDLGAANLDSTRLLEHPPQRITRQASPLGTLAARPAPGMGLGLRGNAHVARRAPRWCAIETHCARHATCAGKRCKGCAQAPGWALPYPCSSLLEPSRPLASSSSSLELGTCGSSRRSRSVVGGLELRFAARSIEFSSDRKKIGDQ